MEQRRYERTMGMFKDAIVAKLAASRPVTHELHLHLQNRLSQLMPSSKIPSHPPYAWMIRRAIRGLNEEGGSTEEAISSCIRKQNDGLPYAHSSFLSHYLGAVVRNGEVCLNGEKYCIPALVHGSEEKKEAKNVHRFKQRRRNTSLRRRSGRTGCLKRTRRKNQKAKDRKRERSEGFMFFGEQNMGSVLEEDEEEKQLGDEKSNRDADGDRQQDTGTACSITPFSIIMQSALTDGSSLPHSKGIHEEGLELRKREIGQKKSQIEDTRISRGALPSLNLGAKGEERTGPVVEYGIKQKEVKGKRTLVCGLAANSTRQQSQPKTSNLQTPASSYLYRESLGQVSCPEMPKIATPERFNQNQERPLKVYYRRKLRVASVYSSRQNQQKAVKIYHEENLPAAEGKESSRSTTMISGLEHNQQVSWAMQRQRTKGIRFRVAKCRIADHKTRSKLGTI